MKFRKKPVVIEAIQWNEDNFEEVKKFTNGNASLVTLFPGDIKAMTIDTLEGVMNCSPGDWVIKGVKGEFYSCKEDIFYETYEEV